MVLITCSILLILTIVGFIISEKKKPIKKYSIDKPCKQYVFTLKPGNENSNHVIVKDCKNQIYGFLVNMGEEISVCVKEIITISSAVKYEEEGPC